MIRFLTERKRLAAAAALAMLALLPSRALAQSAALSIDRGPHYSSVPVDLEVTAEGFEEEPTPEIDPQGPAARYVELVDVSPSVSRAIQIVNGQMTQRTTVRFVYRYRLRVPKAGRYQVGPFRITQGSKTAVTGLANVNVEDIPDAGDMRIDVRFPKGPLYVGQKFKVKVQWSASAEMRGSLIGQLITIPALGRERLFSIDEEATLEAGAREDSVLIVDMPGGPIELPSRETQRKQDGKEYIVRTGEIDLLALRAGEYEFAAPVAVVDQATRWRRDLFGSRRATHARKIQATGTRQNVAIREIPAAGRPAGFAGAIGSAFSIEVTADRSVVQVGDPIELTVKLRGDGTLEAASLPPPIGPGRLSADEFSGPSAGPPGVFDGTTKTFKINVRAISPRVREIPPIEFSWFDPTNEAFATTRSQPIALAVREASRVGADDVITSAPAAAGGASEDARRVKAAATGDAPRAHAPDTNFGFSGADLAVSRDVDALLRSERAEAGGPLTLTAYVLGLAAIAFGGLASRRRSVDPADSERSKRIAGLRAAVDSASDAAGLGDALRRLGTETELGDMRNRFEETLARCDDLAYAPGAAGASLPADLKRDASALAVELAKSANGSGSK